MGVLALERQRRRQTRGKPPRLLSFPGDASPAPAAAHSCYQTVNVLAYVYESLFCCVCFLRVTFPEEKSGLGDEIMFSTYIHLLASMPIPSISNYVVVN
jgi:hypothetical protein